MKPRTLASVGAVLLYLYCEFFGASPFALAECGREASRRTLARPVATEEDEPKADLQELFEPARLGK